MKVRIYTFRISGIAPIPGVSEIFNDMTGEHVGFNFDRTNEVTVSGFDEEGLITIKENEDDYSEKMRNIIFGYYEKEKYRNLEITYLGARTEEKS